MTIEVSGDTFFAGWSRPVTLAMADLASPTSRTRFITLHHLISSVQHFQCSSTTDRFVLVTRIISRTVCAKTSAMWQGHVRLGTHGISLQASQVPSTCFSSFSNFRCELGKGRFKLCDKAASLCCTGQISETCKNSRQAGAISRGSTLLPRISASARLYFPGRLRRHDLPSQ